MRSTEKLKLNETTNWITEKAIRLKTIETSFWDEVEVACKKRDIDFEETQTWIDSLIENLGKRILAYYVSLEAPTFLIDIVVLTKYRTYGFSMTEKKKDYFVHLNRAIISISKEEKGDKVTLNFLQDGMTQGFFITDDIARTQQLTDFVKKFAEIAWG